MKTSIKKILRLANNHDVKVVLKKEQRRVVPVLTGFLADIQNLEREIDGYWVEQTSTGHYLYRDDLLWES